MQRKTFEQPTITTYERDELIVETTFTGLSQSRTVPSDRGLKHGLDAVSARTVLARLKIAK